MTRREAINAADSRQARRSKAVSKANLHRDREDMRYILRDERGRRALYSLMDFGGLLADIAPGKANTDERLGMRRMALEMRRRAEDVQQGVWLIMAGEFENAAHIDALEVQMARGSTHARTDAEDE